MKARTILILVLGLAAPVAAQLELRQSTQVVVVIGPFVDKTDGLTPEDDLVLGSADDCVLVKAGGGVTGISGNTWADVVDANGLSKVTLTTGNTDTRGPLVVYVRDDSIFLPVLCRFQVLDPNLWDSKYSTGELDAHTVRGVNIVDANDNVGVQINTFSKSSGIPTVGAAELKVDASGYVLLSDGTGTGQINLDAGAIAEVIAVTGGVAIDLAAMFNEDSGESAATAVPGSPIYELLQALPELTWEDPNLLTAAAVAEAVWEDANGVALAALVAGLPESVWEDPNGVALAALVAGLPESVWEDPNGVALAALVAGLPESVWEDPNALSHLVLWGDAKNRTLTHFDEDDMTIDLDGTTVNASAIFDANSLYDVWLVPWRGDPNFTSATMGGLLKASASKR